MLARPLDQPVAQPVALWTLGLEETRWREIAADPYAGALLVCTDCAASGAIGPKDQGTHPGMPLASKALIMTMNGRQTLTHEPRQRNLSPRERQILELLQGGQKTPKEVAFELGIADATVRVLYSRAMAKLGRPKRAAARHFK